MPVVKSTTLRFLKLLNDMAVEWKGVKEREVRKNVHIDKCRQHTNDVENCSKQGENDKCLKEKNERIPRTSAAVEFKNNLNFDQRCSGVQKQSQFWGILPGNVLSRIRKLTYCRYD